MKPMSRPMPRVLLTLPVVFLLYFFNLTSVGLLGPDEPRYASIAREMARSGDWITPRLWGQPWFEKPALLYWIEALAFRLSLGEELAPRLPVALTSVAFLLFFFWILRREFGERAAGFATAILATSAGWVAFSHIGVTDIPMAAAFSAAMLVSAGWIERGERNWLSAAAAFLGLAVLAKGLVPVVLAIPMAVFAGKRLLDWLRPQVLAAFLVVALPWYVLAFLRNGQPFLEQFFWHHQVERFSSDALMHGQPFWFLIPVLVVALFPWIPAVGLLFRAHFYSDRRRKFLLLLVVFGLAFFSVSRNKLPGYVLPLVPPLAALAGIALAEAKSGARWVLVTSAGLLVLVPAIAAILPVALASGISRAPLPAVHWTWLLPLTAAAVVWYFDGRGLCAGAVLLLVLAITADVVMIETRTFPVLDRLASARPLWYTVAPVSDRACVARLHRSLRYGLNYYSVTPLPDCHAAPREIEITQDPGAQPRLVNAVAVPANYGTTR